MGALSGNELFCKKIVDVLFSGVWFTEALANSENDQSDDSAATALSSYYLSSFITEI